MESTEKENYTFENNQILLDPIELSGQGSDEGENANSDSPPVSSPRSPKEELPNAICQACLIGDDNEVRAALQNSAAANCTDKEGRTPLHAAAYSDEPHIVQLLLGAGAVVNSKDRMGLTPLHRACGSKAHDVVNLLLGAGADLNKKDKSWQTPLHIAVKSGAVTCTRFLIKAGALVDERDCFGRTPLHLAAGLNTKTTIASASDLCKLLIDKGHASLSVRDNLGRHPIHYGAASGNRQAFKALCDAGAKLDVSDSELFMPIHCAAGVGSAVVLEEIVRAGLITEPSFPHQVEALAQGDQSPLHLAAAGGFDDCVTVLLQNGADPEVQNSVGATPVHYAASAATGYDTMALLLKASSQPHKLATIADSNGRTPVHFAAYFGNFERLKVLLRTSLSDDFCDDDLICSHRAKFALQKDRFGLDPLHYAASQGNAIICRLLVQFCQFQPDSGVLRLASTDCCSVFPLLLSAASGSVDCTKVLLDSLPSHVKNLDSVVDYLDRNCLHIACYSGSVDVVETLVSSQLFSDFNRGCSKFFDWAPVHFISVSRKRETASKCLKILIKHAGDMIDGNQCDDQGRSALMLAVAMDDVSSDGVFNCLINFANADPLMLDYESRSLLHYAAGNGCGGAFEKCAISRVLPPDSRDGDAIILPPADASELVDLALVGPQCNPLHIACYLGLAANLASLVPIMPSLVSSPDKYGWTPLHYAAVIQNAEAAADCVQLLLAGGANVTLKECSNGWTPLHVASYYGVASTVRILVDYVITNSRKSILPEASTFINARDNKLRTALDLAVSSRHRESVCVLLHRRADFKTRDRNRRSALHRAIVIGDAELVQWFSKADPQSLYQKDAIFNRNILHLAVSCGNADIVESIVNSCPRLAIACDFGGVSPIHLAAFRKLSSPSFTSMTSYDDAILNCLLSSLEPEWKTELLAGYCNKLSPFHCAALADRRAAFEKLRDAFFNNDEEAEREHLKSLKDSQGRTILHACFSAGSVSVFSSIFKSLKLVGVSQLLTVKDQAKQWTPVHYAISYGRLTLLRECREMLGEPGLVDLLSDPDILSLAAMKMHENTAQFLLECYLRVNGKEGISSWIGNALKYSIKNGLVVLTEALLQLGLNPMIAPTESVFEAPIFGTCKAESQMACLALALSEYSKLKECWANEQPNGMREAPVQPPTMYGGMSSDEHEDDVDHTSEVIDVNVANQMNSGDSMKIPHDDFGRKSSGSGFSDDNDYF